MNLRSGRRLEHVPRVEPAPKRIPNRALLKQQNENNEDDQVIFVKETRARKRRALGSLENRDLTERTVGLKSKKSRRLSNNRAKKTRVSLLPVAFKSTEPTVECGICFDDIIESKVHKLGSCSHAYCNGCTVQYLRVVALETKKFPVACPDCSDSLDAWRCADAMRESKQEEVADALEQLAIARTQVTTVKYCSNSTCATPFEYDGDGDKRTARIHCPLCRTDTCVMCSKKWHKGACELTEEEEALKRDSRFKQCPSCSELIERTDGCNFVRCRCGSGFCFRCGVKYVSLNRTSRNEHGEAGCNCKIYQGTPYEIAVERARERLRAWKNEQSVLHASASGEVWKIYVDDKWRALFREEYRKVRDGGDARANN